MDCIDGRIDELAIGIEREIERNRQLLEGLPDYPPRPEKRVAGGVVPEQVLWEELGIDNV